MQMIRITARGKKSIQLDRIHEDEAIVQLVSQVFPEEKDYTKDPQAFSLAGYVLADLLTSFISEVACKIGVVKVERVPGSIDIHFDLDVTGPDTEGGILNEYRTSPRFAESLAHNLFPNLNSKRAQVSFTDIVATKVEVEDEDED